MGLEKDTVDKYQPLTGMGLSDDEKNEIWTNVEGNIYEQHRSNVNRTSRRLGPIFAAAAAVVMVGLGGYAVMNHHTQPSVAAHKQPPAKPSMPASIQSVYMTNSKNSQSKWNTDNVNDVSKHVTDWLKQSHPYIVKLAEQPSASQVQMHFTTSDGQTAVVYPVSSLKNVVVYKIHSNSYYLKSPELYDWLQSGKWRTVFVNPADLPYMRLGNLQLNLPLSSTTVLYGKPTTKTIMHGNGSPEWIYKTNGITVDGNPIWQIRVTAPFHGALTNGIRIGSSKGAVAKAYPNVVPHSLPDGTWYTPSSPDRKYQETIGVQKGIVTSITIMRNVGQDTQPQW